MLTYVIFLFLFLENCLTCSCSSKNGFEVFSDIFSDSDYELIFRSEAIRNFNQTDVNNDTHIFTEHDVLSTFKGEVSDTLVTHNGEESSTCRKIYNVGEKYYVFTKLGTVEDLGEDHYTVGLCDSGRSVWFYEVMFLYLNKGGVAAWIGTGAGIFIIIAAVVCCCCCCCCIILCILGIPIVAIPVLVIYVKNNQYKHPLIDEMGGDDFGDDDDDSEDVGVEMEDIKDLKISDSDSDDKDIFDDTLSD